MRPQSAIPFILRDPQTHNYYLSNYARSFLQTLTRPVAVVSVAGPYRTGKSYLLNRVLLNVNRGFGVGNTVNACTKGLWMWPEAIKGSDGQSVLVVDTYGMGALYYEANHDLKVICLAVLLSSTFVYNSVGSIDENALQTLALALNMAVLVQDGGDRVPPDLFWIVRDFALELVDTQGNILTPDEYLNLALKIDATCRDTNKISLRETIAKAFKAKNCHTLIKPVIDYGKLQRLEELSQDYLRNDFVTQSIQLRKRVLGAARYLRLGSGTVNGPTLILLAETYLKNINYGKVPNISDTFTYIKQERERAVCYELERAYTERIKARVQAKLPLPTSLLQESLLCLYQYLRTEFCRLSQQSVHSNIDLPTTLRDFCTRAFHSITRQNTDLTRTAIRTLLNATFEPFSRKLHSKYYSDFHAFSDDLQKNFRVSLLEKQGDRLDGFAFYLDAYLDKRLGEGYRFFDNLNQYTINNLKAAQASLQQTHGLYLQIMSEDFTHRVKSLTTQCDGLYKYVSTLRDELSRKSYSLNQQLSEQTQLSQTLKHKLTQSYSELANLQRQLSVETEARRQSESVLYQLRIDLYKERALSVQRERLEETRRKEWERSIEEAKIRAKQYYGRADEARKAQVQLLEAQLKDYNAKVARLSELNQDLYAEGKRLQYEIVRVINRDIGRTENEKTVACPKQSISIEYHATYISLQQSYDQLTQSYQTLKESSEKKVRELSESVRTMTEVYKSQSHGQQSQLLLLYQNLQFSQLYLEYTKLSLQYLQKRYNSAIELLQQPNGQGEKSAMEARLRHVEAESREMKRELEMRHQEELARLRRELTEVKHYSEEFERQKNVEVYKYKAIISELEADSRKQIQLNSQLQTQLQQAEGNSNTAATQKEQYLLTLINQKDNELYELRNSSNGELEAMQSRQTKAIEAMKDYAAKYKQHWYSILDDEKERGRTRLEALGDYLRARNEEEKVALYEEIRYLVEKIHIHYRQTSYRLQTMQCDSDIRVEKLTSQFMEERLQLAKQVALLQQELELTRTSLTGQMEERRKQQYMAMEGLRAQLEAELDQMRAKTDQERRELENKCESLKKNAQQSYKTILVLRSECEREKAVSKEREKHLGGQIVELENRLSTELLANTTTLYRLTEDSRRERYRLNTYIERLKALNLRAEEERNEIQASFYVYRNNLRIKNDYLNSRIERSRVDQEHFMKNFYIAMEHMTNNKGAAADEGYEKARLNFERQLAEKEAMCTQIVRENDERIARLHTENKSLKDRLVGLESRLGQARGGQEDVERMRYKYEAQIQRLRSEVSELRRREESDWGGRDEDNRNSKRTDRGSYLASEYSVYLDKSRRNSGISTGHQNVTSRPINNVPLAELSSTNRMGEATQQFIGFKNTVNNTNVGQQPAPRKTPTTGRVINLNYVTGVMRFIGKD